MYDRRSLNRKSKRKTVEKYNKTNYRLKSNKEIWVMESEQVHTEACRFKPGTSDLNLYALTMGNYFPLIHKLSKVIDISVTVS